MTIRRGTSFRLLVTVVLLGVTSACVGAGRPEQDESHADGAMDPTVIRSDTASYIAASLPDGVLVVVVTEQESDDEIVLLDSARVEVDRVPRRDRAGCFSTVIWAVAQLPTGELGFVEVCHHDVGDRPMDSELFAYDTARKTLRSLGTTILPAKAIAWAPDMSGALYAGGWPLCFTLYERDADGSDSPFAREVLVGDRPLLLGEDVWAADDRCTRHGNADYPAYSADGSTLALMARRSDGVSGQGRIDMPWALMILSPDGTEKTLVEGILEPRGLDWLTGDLLVFTGRVGGRDGLWTVHRDGSGLTRVGRRGLTLMSINRADMTVVGVASVAELPADPTRPLVAESIRYDLRDILASFDRP